MKKLGLLILSSLFSFSTLSAQLFPGNGITVRENGIELPNPWLGGLDLPQFSGADINQDGREDLLIFDKKGNKTLVLLKDEKDFLNDLENESKTEKDFEEKNKKIRLLLKNDEEAFYVFDELLKNNNSDIKTSKALGLSIEKVRNAKKRIRRKSIEIFTLKTK